MLVNLQYRGEIYMSDSLTAVGCRPAGLSPCATRYNMAERRAGCFDMRLIQLSPQVALVSNAIRRAQQRGGKLIVLESRKSESAEVAASGLSLKPGPDEAMCCGRLKALSSRGRIWPRNQMTMGKKGSPTNCFNVFGGAQGKSRVRPSTAFRYRLQMADIERIADLGRAQTGH
ncbi:hypothetical protein [Paraburkholderia hospita]|uniref:hypothetical protein n=1 Tax=Paraburkholderia hospita TaxID=169430 RepID=UPI0012601271|nr:hypothetical protein [Paraburkholderia hospita]